jgi:hypothetical protein
MRTQIATDSESRPYPLSAKTFMAGSDGSIAVYQNAADVDPRADSASNN